MSYLSTEQTVNEEKLLSIILPVLGVKEPVNETLEMIPYDKINNLDYAVEVLIVFTPNPPESKEELEILDSHARIVHQEERGYGNAYRAGFREAKGDILITLDADQTYPAEEIPDLIEILEEKNVEFLNTNRLKNFEKGAFPRMNYFGNKLFSLFGRLFLRMPFKDSQSGMWIFKQSFLDKVDFKQTGMEFSTEIKLKASRVCDCAEESIFYRKRDSEATLRWFRDGLRIAKFLLREFWLTLRGKELEK
ncbi:MAG: glycosyltransferase [Candidatus Heimdallarchaeota archaeon]|nr:glycosyltransferase [Candidatus Heimdallarchaeota archaeon]